MSNALVKAKRRSVHSILTFSNLTSFMAVFKIKVAITF